MRFNTTAWSNAHAKGFRPLCSHNDWLPSMSICKDFAVMRAPSTHFFSAPASFSLSAPVAVQSQPQQDEAKACLAVATAATTSPSSTSFDPACRCRGKRKAAELANAGIKQIAAGTLLPASGESLYDNSSSHVPDAAMRLDHDDKKDDPEDTFESDYQGPKCEPLKNKGKRSNNNKKRATISRGQTQMSWFTHATLHERIPFAVVDSLAQLDGLEFPSAEMYNRPGTPLGVHVSKTVVNALEEANRRFLLETSASLMGGIGLAQRDDDNDDADDLHFMSPSEANPEWVAVHLGVSRETYTNEDGHAASTPFVLVNSPTNKAKRTLRCHSAIPWTFQRDLLISLQKHLESKKLTIRPMKWLLDLGAARPLGLMALADFKSGAIITGPYQGKAIPESAALTSGYVFRLQTTIKAKQTRANGKPGQSGGAIYIDGVDICWSNMARFANCANKTSGPANAHMTRNGSLVADREIKANEEILFVYSTDQTIAF